MSEEIYSPPKADLGLPAPSINDLPRFSTWWVFLLSMITLYIYALYWMYDRSIKLNRIVSEHQISPFWIYGVPIFWMGTLILDMLDLYLQLELYTDNLSLLFNVISNIIVIFWAFSIRRSIRIIISKDVDINVKTVGPILTFFFSPYYLAYKINELKDSAAQGPGKPVED